MYKLCINYLTYLLSIYLCVYTVLLRIPFKASACHVNVITRLHVNHAHQSRDRLPTDAGAVERYFTFDIIPPTSCCCCCCCCCLVAVNSPWTVDDAAVCRRDASSDVERLSILLSQVNVCVFVCDSRGLRESCCACRCHYQQRSRRVDCSLQLDWRDVVSHMFTVSLDRFRRKLLHSRQYV